MASGDTQQSIPEAAWVQRAQNLAPAAWTPARTEWIAWTGVPLLLAGIVLAVAIFYPAFYAERFLPEGHGVLEVLHFLLPLVAGLMCIWLLFRPAVRANTIIRV
nr:hypothetical protein [Alphaproteobacteria bacterium]